MLRIVKVLAKNQVRKVTIGGGEPLLRSDLERILGALKEKGIFVSLHTNGTILKPRIEGLKGLVDMLSLPLDSMDEEENQIMRGRPYVGLVEEIMSYAHPSFKLAFKTTATKVNKGNIPRIYDSISRVPFEYWKVYQFRPLNEARSYQRDFNLTAREFGQLRVQLMSLEDRRVQVISREEGHQPYVFLDNQGNVSTVHPTAEENIWVGNLFAHQLTAIGQCIDSLHDRERIVSRPRKVSIKWRSNVDYCIVKEDKLGPITIRLVTATQYDDPRLAYYSDD